MSQEWKLKSIDEIAIVGRGRSKHRPRNDPALYGGSYPFVQTADIHASDLYINSFSKTYSDLGLAQSKLWKPGVLCITNAGENTGDCAILNIEACFPDSIIAVTPKPEGADVYFLKYAVDRLRDQLRSVTKGATQDNLSVSKLVSFKFPVPSFSTQKHIGEVLRTYGDLIENNRRRIQLLEQSARLLYKEWFVYLRFPGHEHVAIDDGIPEGWKKKNLCDVAEITMGQSPNSEYYNEDSIGLPFHQGVSNFGDRFPKHKIFCTLESRVAQPGDILFSVRAPVGRINLTQDKIVIGRGLAAIRSKIEHQNFLFYQLKNYFFKEDMIGGGAIFAAITKKDLHSVELLTPSSSLIKLFTEHVSSIDQQIAILHVIANQLEQARDLLLPRLMNGAIAV